MGLKPRITKEQEAWENSPRNKENWTSWNKLQEEKEPAPHKEIKEVQDLTSK